MTAFSRRTSCSFSGEEYYVPAKSRQVIVSSSLSSLMLTRKVRGLSNRRGTSVSGACAANGLAQPQLTSATSVRIRVAKPGISSHGLHACANPCRTQFGKSSCRRKDRKWSPISTDGRRKKTPHEVTSQSSDVAGQQSVVRSTKSYAITRSTEHNLTVFGRVLADVRSSLQSLCLLCGELSTASCALAICYPVVSFWRKDFFVRALRGIV